MLKDFETDLKILQVIGHLIQWTSDLILHQVTSVRKTALDLEDISTARQLLLIIRLWSFLLSACTPQFTVKDSTTDVISEAYKLLTEIWTRVQDKAEIPNEILDRCERLAGKVYVEQPRIEPPIRSENWP